MRGIVAHVTFCGTLQLRFAPDVAECGICGRISPAYKELRMHRIFALNDTHREALIQSWAHKYGVVLGAVDE